MRSTLPPPTPPRTCHHRFATMRALPSPPPHLAFQKRCAIHALSNAPCAVPHPIASDAPPSPYLPTSHILAPPSYPAHAAYSWDEASAEGVFSWRYGTCCTDGLILGPLPGSDGGSGGGGGGGGGGATGGATNYSLSLSFDPILATGVHTVALMSLDRTAAHLPTPTYQYSHEDFSLAAAAVEAGGSGALTLEFSVGESSAQSALRPCSAHALAPLAQVSAQT